MNPLDDTLTEEQARIEARAWVAALAACDREIASAESYLVAGGPEELGAYVGLTDWQEEN